MLHNNRLSIANSHGMADRVTDPSGTPIEGDMKTAFAAKSFGNSRPGTVSVETDWHPVRLNAIGEAWSLYRRHWGVWSLTMLVAWACVTIGTGLCTLLLRTASIGMFGGLFGLGGAGLWVVHPGLDHRRFLSGRNDPDGRQPGAAASLHASKICSASGMSGSTWSWVPACWDSFSLSARKLVLPGLISAGC